MERFDTIKCDKCGKEFTSGNTNGLPNGLSFSTQDGKFITLCQACVMELGRIKEADDELAAKSFWRELGVEV